MNYSWREATLGWLRSDMDTLDYDRTLTRLRMAYPLEIRRGLLNLLGSQDTSRIRTELSSVEKAAQATVLLLTAPGVPMIYYGDEIGMEGRGDVAARGCYPWNKSRQQHSGLFALYKRLLRIRREHPWLNDGVWETICADPAANLFAFHRQSTALESPDYSREAFALTIALNNSRRAQTFEVPTSALLTNLTAGCFQSGTLDADNRLTLPPYGLAVFAPASGV